MSLEIERKFLVRETAMLRGLQGERLVQAYIATTERATVRVRIAGERAWLTLKGATTGISRRELEYAIPVADAELCLAELCGEGVVSKTRYRIPQGLRDTPSAKSESWNTRVLAYERVGKTGTMSCTPTGVGGWTGCSQRLIDQAYAEKKGEDMSFAKLIEEERAKRTATIDADAQATQARVEQAEKEYEARQRAEAEAAEKAKQDAAAGK